MNPQPRAVFVSFVKVLGILAASGVICVILSAIGMSYLFRSREEAPVSELEAKQRLEPVWLGLSPLKTESIRILHHRKEIIWDGTTHEEWVVFVPGDFKLSTTSSPFLRIDHPTAWPLPESAITAGYQALPTAVHIAENSTSSSGTERPTKTRAVIWPTSAGHIARYEFTVID